MGNIEKGNFIDVPHRIVEWKDDEGSHYPLCHFKNSSLKLYIALRHFANRFTSSTFFMDDEKMRKVTGLSYRQLCRARKTLCELRLISTSKRKDRAIDYEIRVSQE